MGREKEEKERMRKRQKTEFNPSSSKWNKVPIDLLAQICSKTQDSCQFHFTFASVCKSFHESAKKPHSWNPILSIQTSTGHGTRPSVFSLYTNDKGMLLNPEMTEQVKRSIQKLSVKNLETTRFNLENEQLSQILEAIEFSQLETLSTTMRVPPKLLKRLEEKTCPLLKEMNIYYPREERLIGPHFLPSTLTSLEIHENFVNGFVLPETKSSVVLPRLTSLTLDGIHILTLQTVLDFHSLHSLKHLKLEHCKVNDFSWLKSCSKLQTLVFDIESIDLYATLGFANAQQLLDMAQMFRFSVAKTMDIIIRMTDGQFELASEERKVLFQAICMNTHVEHLKMNTLYLPEDSSAFANMKQLKTLEIVCENVLETRQLSCPPFLQSLYWKERFNTDQESTSAEEMIQFFSGFGDKYTSLTWLHLTEVELSIAFDLTIFPNLRTIVLEDCQGQESDDSYKDNPILFPSSLSHVYIQPGADISFIPVLLESMAVSKCPIEFLQLVDFDYNSFRPVMKMKETIKKLELRTRTAENIFSMSVFDHFPHLVSLCLEVNKWHQISFVDQLIKRLKMHPLEKLQELKILARTIDDDEASEDETERDDTFERINKLFMERFLTECTFNNLQTCWIILEREKNSTAAEEFEIRKRMKTRFPTLKQIKYKESWNPQRSFPIVGAALPL